VSAEDFGGGCYRSETVQRNGDEERVVSLDTQPCVECGTCAVVADTEWEHPVAGRVSSSNRDERPVAVLGSASSRWRTAPSGTASASSRPRSRRTRRRPSSTSARASVRPSPSTSRADRRRARAVHRRRTLPARTVAEQLAVAVRAVLRRATRRRLLHPRGRDGARRHAERRRHGPGAHARARAGERGELTPTVAW